MVDVQPPPKKKNRVSEFLLPVEIKHLQEGLADYTEALVESSGFYEPFFFEEYTW